MPRDCGMGFQKTCEIGTPSQTRSACGERCAHARRKPACPAHAAWSKDRHPYNGIIDETCNRPCAHEEPGSNATEADEGVVLGEGNWFFGAVPTRHHENRWRTGCKEQIVQWSIGQHDPKFAIFPAQRRGETHAPEVTRSAELGRSIRHGLRR